MATSPAINALHEGILLHTRNFLLEYNNVLNFWGYNVQLLDESKLKFRLHIAKDAGIFGVRSPRGFHFDFSATTTNLSILPRLHDHLYRTFFK